MVPKHKDQWGGVVHRVPVDHLFYFPPAGCSHALRPFTGGLRCATAPSHFLARCRFTGTPYPRSGQGENEKALYLFSPRLHERCASSIITGCIVA